MHLLKHGFIILLGAVLWFSKVAHAQQWPLSVTYASVAQPITAGDTVRGDFVGATDNLHAYYNPDSGNYAGGVYDSQTPERSFRFHLDSAQIIYIKQLSTARHEIILCLDSSSASAVYWADYWQYAYLDSGTYYFSLEQDTTAETYAFVLLTSRNAISIATDVHPFAEPGTANGHITGNLVGAVDHVQHYDISYPWRFHGYPNYGLYQSYRPFSVEYTPEPDRIFSIVLPDTSYVTISPIHMRGQHAHFIRADGRSDHSTAIFNGPAAYPAGTYYLAIEQGSATLADEFDFYVETRTIYLPCRQVASLGEDTSRTYGNYMGVDINDADFSVGYAINQLNHYPRYRDLFLSAGAANLYYGGFTNQIYVSNIYHGKQYPYIYLGFDLNEDGDFDDPQEFAQLQDSLVIRGKLSLPSGPAWDSAVGNAIRMRFIMADTLVTAACGVSDTHAFVLDGQAHLKPSPTGPKQAEWLTYMWGTSANYWHMRYTLDGTLYGIGHAKYWNQLENGTSTRFEGGGSLYVSDVNGRIEGFSDSYTNQQGYNTDIAFMSMYDLNGRLKGLDVYRPYTNVFSGGGSQVAFMDASTGPDSTLALAQSGWQEHQFYAGTVNVLKKGSYAYNFTINDGSRNDRYHEGSTNSTAYALDGSLFVAGSILSSYIKGPLDPPYYSSGARDTLHVPGGAQNEGVLLKIRPDKHPAWCIGLKGAGNYLTINKVSVAPNGQIYIVGGYTTTASLLTSVSAQQLDLPTVEGRFAFAASISESGILLWARALQPIPPANENLYGTDNLAITGFEAAPDGSGAVLSGIFSDTLQVDTLQRISAGGQDGYVLKINYDGTLAWLTTAGGVSNDAVSAVHFTPGGPSVSYNFIGHQRNPFGNGMLDSLTPYQCGVILPLHAQTGQVDTRPGYMRLTGTGNVNIADFVPLADSGAVLVGGLGGGIALAGLGYYSNDGGYVMRARTNLGYANIDSSLTAVKIPIPKLQALIPYPNPTSGSFAIRGQSTTGAFSLSNTLGKEVLQIQLAPGGRVKTTGLAAGVYIWRLQMPGFLPRIGRVVVE